MSRLKVLLIKLAKKNHVFLMLLRKIIFIRVRLISLYYNLSQKVDDNLILLEAYMGRSYSDSQKAIYQYMMAKDKKYKFVWIFKNQSDYLYLENDRTIVVKYNSKSYYKYCSKAKYWITNSRMKEALLKRKKQVYIQTWHGTPLKRLGCDIEVKNGNAMNSIKDIHMGYRKDSKRYNYMISPSKYCTEKFISAFDIKNKNIIKEIGYPRNDFLINYTSKDVNDIKRTLKIPKNKKVILYAPTWRDNQHKSDMGYTYKTNVDFDMLKERLGSEYVILFRAHYLISNTFDFDKYKNFIFDVSHYDDINELYIISDVLITDYSSVFFDYAILKRPIIFYMYDLENYKNNLRDFYINLDELPGPIIENDKDLIRKIKDIDNFNYTIKYKNFNKKYNYLDDGKCCKRLFDIVLSSEE